MLFPPAQLHCSSHKSHNQGPRALVTDVGDCCVVVMSFQTPCQSLGEVQQACWRGINESVSENEKLLGTPSTGSCTYGEANFQEAQDTFSTCSLKGLVTYLHNQTEYAHITSSVPTLETLLSNRGKGKPPNLRREGCGKWVIIE